MVATRIATLQQGARTDLSPIGEKSQQEAADLLDVGKRSVERARKLKRKSLRHVATSFARSAVALVIRRSRALAPDTSAPAKT
jgi:hypothetical protein